MRLDLLVADVAEAAPAGTGPKRGTTSYLQPPTTGRTRRRSSAPSETSSTMRRSGALWARRSRSSLRPGQLVVRDHGPGISDEDLPYVFDRFYRARAARGLPGSGLGLAIVRQVAESHGGGVARRACGDGSSRTRMVLTLGAERHRGRRRGFLATSGRAAVCMRDGRLSGEGNALPERRSRSRRIFLACSPLS